MNAYSDYYELMMIVCGKDPENEAEFAEFEDNGEDLLMEKLGVDSETFEAVAAALIPYAAEGVSPLTKKHYRGFARGNEWIVKMEVKS